MSAPAARHTSRRHAWNSVAHVARAPLRATGGRKRDPGSTYRREFRCESERLSRAMTVVTVEHIVQRPPEGVFDFVARHHFENNPRWDPDLVEMRQTSPGPMGIGSTARVVRRRGRRRVEGTATVHAYDPDRVAAWHVRFGPIRLDQRAELIRERGGAATRLRLCIDTTANGPIRVVLPLLRARFRETMGKSLRTIARIAMAAVVSDRRLRPHIVRRRLEAAMEATAPAAAS
jgi:hypothetical protein